MAINFPTSPSVNDLYSYGGKTWSWTGTAWKLANLDIAFKSNADNFTGDGSTVNFTLSVAPTSTSYTIVAVGGVVQPRSYYSVSSSTLTFTTAPPSGALIEVTSMGGNAVPAGTASFTSLSLVGLLTEGFVTKTGATGTVAHDVTSSGTFYHTSPVANFTANFTNVPTTASKIIVVTLVIAQGSTPYVPSTFQIDGSTTTVSWLGGSAPSGTASKYDVISYSLFRVGSSWIVFGSASTFG